MSSENGHFYIYIDEAGEYRWRLRAPNNEIIAVGEGYNTKQGCQNGIAAVRKYAPKAIVVDDTK